MKHDKAAITLGADVGGKDAHAATAEVCMQFRQALAMECLGPYSPSLKEFALVVRIDGSVQSWGKSGVDNVRLQRKSNYASADIFVPKAVWVEGPEVFRAFLATGIEAAIETIVHRVEQAQVQVESVQLIGDVKRAMKRLV